MILQTVGLKAWYQKFPLSLRDFGWYFSYNEIRHVFPRQFGFQSRTSVVQQLLDFIETINFGKVEKFILYLDYAKTLDKDWLNVLLSKLSSVGVDD